MAINDGGGLYDKFGLIDSIIKQIDGLAVQGVKNAATICDIYNKLNALKKGLREEEKEMNGSDANGSI